MAGTGVTAEFIAKLRERIDGGISLHIDRDLLRECVEYIAVIDSGLDRSMELTEKALACVQLQGKRIEQLEAECFTLSAGVCKHRSGDDHGNPYCLKSKTNI